MMDDKVIQNAKKKTEMQKSFLESDSGKALINMHESTLKSMRDAGMFEQFERMFELNKALMPIFPKLTPQDQNTIVESYKEIEDVKTDKNKQEKPITKIEKVVKRNPTKQTKEILENLIPYFENDLPYKKQSDLSSGLTAKEYNSKITTYLMQGIAEYYEVHIRTIQRIAKQYKDDYKDFLASKK